MSVAVLVSSHDGYAKAWKPFAYSFHKYWPDCPWPVYFVSNYLTSPFGHPVLVGDDGGKWGTAMTRALQQVQSDVVVMMLEDYWLTAPTDTKSIKEFAEHIESGFADYIKLNPSADATYPYLYDPRLAGYRVDAPYRTSMQIALWNTSLLRSLIWEGESIWEFESTGSMRAGDQPTFLAATEFRYIHYIHPDDPAFTWSAGAIEQGKFTESAYRWANQEGIVLP